MENQAVATDAGMNILPNPTSGAFAVHFVGVDRSAGLRLQILDLTGRVLRDVVFANEFGDVAIDIQYEPKAVYLVQAVVGQDLFTQKIVKH